MTVCMRIQGVPGDQLIPDRAPKIAMAAFLDLYRDFETVMGNCNIRSFVIRVAAFGLNVYTQPVHMMPQIV